MVKYKSSAGGRVFDVFNHTALLLFTLLCIYPFYYILMYSLSDSAAVSNASPLIIPVNFTLKTYKALLGQASIYMAMFISMSRAIVGTVITVFCCSLFAYQLTQKDLFLRGVIYRYTLITMYVSAGLIPWYMTMMMLRLQNNYLLYVLPSAVSAFYVILIKTYIEQIPPSLEESARIDGAGYLKIFFRIIFPLSKPIIAAIAVFSAVGQWNSWTDNLYLTSSVTSLTTLQYLLYQMLSTNQANAMAGSLTSGLSTMHPAVVSSMSIKMTISMITVIPILIVYPLMQKYFVKGVMIGAVKG